MNWGIIIIDVAVEYVYFCKLGPKEYIEGETVKMYIRLNILSPKLCFFFFVSLELKSLYHHLTNKKCLRGTQCA